MLATMLVWLGSNGKKMPKMKDFLPWQLKKVRKLPKQKVSLCQSHPLRLKKLLLPKTSEQKVLELTEKLMVKS